MSKLTLEQEEELSGKLIKNCPMCKKATFLDGGCNYMKCSNSDPISSCEASWCFLCGLIKYKPLEGSNECCNDVSHNSH